MKYSDLIIAAVLCSACAPQDGGSDWAGRVETVDGATVTINPEVPILTATDVGFERQWTLRSRTDADSLLWLDPSVIHAREGVVYVLDPTAGSVRMIAASGADLGSFGRPGAGPGELKGAFALASTTDHMVVGNGGNGRLEVFELDGTYSDAVPLTGPTFHMTGVDAETLLLQQLGGASTEWYTLSIEERNATPFTLPRAAVADTLLADCQRVHVQRNITYRLNCYVPAFTRADASSGLIDIVRVTREAEPATPEELQYLERTISTMIAEVGYPPDVTRDIIEQEVDKQRTRRAFRRIAASDEMVLVWEQTPEELGNSTAILHVFTATGMYVARWEAASAWSDIALDGRTLYTLELDADTGLKALAAYTIGLSPEAEAWFEKETPDGGVSPSRAVPYGLRASYGLRARHGPAPGRTDSRR